MVKECGDSEGESGVSVYVYIFGRKAGEMGRQLGEGNGEVKGTEAARAVCEPCEH